MTDSQRGFLKSKSRQSSIFPSAADRQVTQIGEKQRVQFMP